jgi:hypothetical protein
MTSTLNRGGQNLRYAHHLIIIVYKVLLMPNIFNFLLSLCGHKTLMFKYDFIRRNPNLRTAHHLSHINILPLLSGLCKSSHYGKHLCQVVSIFSTDLTDTGRAISTKPANRQSDGRPGAKTFMKNSFTRMCKKQNDLWTRTLTKIIGLERADDMHK